ncbi:MAG: iron chelate uptake ABC transporter family permease subunit [Planctomycetaceae bacterium]
MFAPWNPITTLAEAAPPESIQWLRVLLLEDYNTRVVVLATTLLGLAAGAVGSFTLLRKRALLGDALSHATLPGIALAFITAPIFGVDGKSLPVLLTGAAISGSIGMLTILLIRNLTRLKEDAALGIVLSVFFGGGLVALGIAQQMPEGHVAGLESFIYGKTASIIAQDAWWIAAAGAISAAVLILLYKEMQLLCFDEGFASSRGYSTIGLDFVLMAMVVLVTIVGLQAVGLVLMIALLVIPAAAARFWTSSMLRMTLLSAVIGAVSCMVGAVTSALATRLPSGAMIVLVSAVFFLLSMLLGSRRGVVVQAWRRWRLRRRIDRRHVLRGIYELAESERRDEPEPVASQWVPISKLLAMRTWSSMRLHAEIKRLRQQGMVRTRNGDVTLTSPGLLEAIRLTREHRLWELYLITHADVATERVDRDAESIEDCLEPVMIDELETLLDQYRTGDRVPVSPHGLTDVSRTVGSN